MKRPKVLDYPDLRVYAIAADEYMIKQEEINTELLEALQSLKERIEKCKSNPITVSEMYDSYYEELVNEAIEKSTL